MSVDRVETVKLAEKIPVYDVVVNPDNPYFALTAGIMSHNTLPADSNPKRHLVTRFRGGCVAAPDFSQAELRVCGRAANDESLLGAYREGIDVHLKTAQSIFGREEVTEVERRFSKMGTFQILYGGTPESFGMAFLNGEVELARKIFDGFFRAYPDVKQWMQDRYDEIQEKGYVTTMTSRAIYLGFESPMQGLDKIMRQAGNAPEIEVLA